MEQTQVAVDLFDGRSDVRVLSSSVLVSDLLIQLSRDFKFPLTEYSLCTKVEARNGEIKYVECKRSSAISDFATRGDTGPIRFLVMKKTAAPTSRKLGILNPKQREERTIFKNIAEATDFEHRKLLYENNHALLVALPNQRVMAVRIGPQTTVSNVLRAIVTQKPEQFSIESCYLVHPRTGEKLEDDRPLLSTYDVTQVRLVCRGMQNGLQSEAPMQPAMQAVAPPSGSQQNGNSLKYRRSFFEFFGLKPSWKKSTARTQPQGTRIVVNSSVDAKPVPTVLGSQFGSLPNLVVAANNEPGMSFSLHADTTDSNLDDVNNDVNEDDEEF